MASPNLNPEKWSTVVLELQEKTRQREARKAAHQAAIDRAFLLGQRAQMLYINAWDVDVSPAIRDRFLQVSEARFKEFYRMGWQTWRDAEATS